MYFVNLSIVIFITLAFTRFSSITCATITINQQPSCICHRGYLAKAHPHDQKTYCQGILHEGRAPCLNLERPNCKCTLGQGNIIQDLYGYWCIKVKPGFVEEIRWDCENRRDWDAFFKIYPEEKPVSNSDLCC